MQDTTTLLQRPSTFRHSAYTLAAALLLALGLLLVAARADAQEGRVMRDEGIRYLKLAGTYRQAQNYELALRFANRGLQMVTNQGSQYWEAAGYETLGLIYRDMGDRTTALNYLQRASTIYNRIIRQKDGSNAAIDMLIDDLLQTESPDVNTEALRSELKRNQEINRQLNDRITNLDNRIRQLDDKARAGSGAPDALRRDPSQQDPTASRPQGQYAPYGTDKKPVPPKQQVVAADTAKSKQPELAKLVLQLGAGVGFGLNTAAISPSTTFASTTGTTTLTPTSQLSGLMVSLSADYFLTPNLSVGLIGAYNFPLLNAVAPTTARFDSLRVGNTNTLARVDTTALTRTGISSYQLVGLRIAYHIVRDRTFDFYAGLSGGVVWPSSQLQWQAGLLLGAQVNFTPLLGVFIDGVVGAASNNTYRLDGTFSSSVLGLGAYGRAGIALSF
jgi:tetratricopeptide (TPR) repeat protein